MFCGAKSPQGGVSALCARHRGNLGCRDHANVFAWQMPICEMASWPFEDWQFVQLARSPLPETCSTPDPLPVTRVGDSAAGAVGTRVRASEKVGPGVRECNLPHPRLGFEAGCSAAPASAPPLLLFLSHCPTVLSVLALSLVQREQSWGSKSDREPGRAYCLHDPMRQGTEEACAKLMPIVIRSKQHTLQVYMGCFMHTVFGQASFYFHKATHTHTGYLV